MPILNLIAKTPSQELIKAYLEEYASELLAKKINQGVIVEKEGKRVINRKTLEGFMKFACNEARKQAEKSENSACIEDSVVFGWAVHYFEESTIEEKLINEDGTEYAPVKKAVSVKPVESPKPKFKPQISLFDIMPAEEDEEEIAAEDGQEAFEELTESRKNTDLFAEQGKHWVDEKTYVDDDGVMHKLEEEKAPSAYEPDSLCILQELFDKEFILR